MTSLHESLRLADVDRAQPRRSRRFVRARPWLIALALSLMLAGGFALARWRASGAAVEHPPRAAVAQPARDSAALDASGYVVARRQATVSALTTGKVMATFVEEGQRVEAGQLIAQLDDQGAQAALALSVAREQGARAALEAARIGRRNAEPIFRRAEAQWRRSLVSAQAFDVATAEFEAVQAREALAEHDVRIAEAASRLARQAVEDTRVRAPFAGVMTVKAAQEGEIVSPGSSAQGFTRTGIGTIVDMTSLEVEVDVSETYIQRVQVGQRASVTLSAYPQWKIPAHVVATIPTADRARGTVRVRVGLEERDERILPNMGARVAFRERS